MKTSSAQTAAAHRILLSRCSWLPSACLPRWNKEGCLRRLKAKHWTKQVVLVNECNQQMLHLL